GLLEKHGATIKSLEKWDDRRLAYEIGPMRRGTYFLTVFQMDPTKTNVFRRDCNLSEKVVRHLLIQDDKMMALLEERVVIAKKREAEALQAQSEGLRPRRERPRR
ncbi:MAG: 30S ribosomal protein S6, partial [Planctomycetota bacterium]